MTKASGDYGVDVVATVQFGITTITEVVQVKRRQDSIQRPTLDQLLDHLIKYKIGMKNRPVSLDEIDEEYFRATVEPLEEEYSLQEELD